MFFQEAFRCLIGGKYRCLLFVVAAVILRTSQLPGRVSAGPGRATGSGGIHQGDVRERLREVADQPAGFRVVFL